MVKMKGCGPYGAAAYCPENTVIGNCVIVDVIERQQQHIITFKYLFENTNGIKGYDNANVFFYITL